MAERTVSFDASKEGRRCDSSQPLGGVRAEMTRPCSMRKQLHVSPCPCASAQRNPPKPDRDFFCCKPHMHRSSGDCRDTARNETNAKTEYAGGLRAVPASVR